MNPLIEFWVPGIPQPGGSKDGFYNPKLGRVMIVDSNKKVKPWRACVSAAAQEAMGNMPPLMGPLIVRFDFVYNRPKGHFGSGKNAGVLKRNAPAFHVVKPDTTKLVRAAEDALKGITWKDDSQITTQGASKRYGNQPGCRIRISPEKV